MIALTGATGFIGINLIEQLGSKKIKCLVRKYTEKLNKNLVDSCKKNKIKRIIFVSSMASTKDYLDDYGRSKRAAEVLIKKSGLDYTILRPSFVYGKNSNSMKKVIAFLNS